MKQNNNRNQPSVIFKSLIGCFRTNVSDELGNDLPPPILYNSSVETGSETKKKSVSVWVRSIDDDDESGCNETEARSLSSTPPVTIQVVIPDMFRSFMAVKPTINPRYQAVKKTAEDWISKKLKADLRACKVISNTNFALFASIAAPDASEEELRTLCDWGNWQLTFGEVFDNGALKDDSGLAEVVMTRLLADMKPRRASLESSSPSAPLLEIHREISSRISQNAPEVVKHRFKSAMRNYCEGVLEHVDHISNSRKPLMIEYMAARRRGLGMEPLIVLVEYAQKIDIPEDVYHHNALRELRHILTDMVLIQNDVLSYCKEQSEGVAHNIITVLRAQGKTTQEAFDYAGELLKDAYRDWYLSQARLPQWTEEIDVEVLRYIAALQSMMLASLHWHFSSNRYFGDRKDEVRKHRIITVLADTNRLSCN